MLEQKITNGRISKNSILKTNKINQIGGLMRPLIWLMVLLSIFNLSFAKSLPKAATNDKVH
jgi:hypothetical protein